jgi:hypothetical protein
MLTISTKKFKCIGVVSSYKTTRCHIPENHNVNHHCCENLNTYFNHTESKFMHMLPHKLSESEK